MRKVIVKQPNEKYCAFSPVIDNVLFFDATKEDLIEIYKKENHPNPVKKVERVLLNNSSFTFNLMLDKIEEIHGKPERIKIENEIQP